MKTNPMACDERQLLSILRSQKLDIESDDLMRHVEHCSYCQHRLEELAATPEEWKKASDAMSTGSTASLEDDASGENAGVRFSRWLEGNGFWTESFARQMLSPPSHPELLGRLGRYEVERIIGAGGMGVVFKAFDSELNRPVAIKLLAPFLTGSGSARKRFSREARAAAAIVHDHVVPIYNVETERDAPFLVMQYVAGESLQARIDRTGPLQLCEILRIGMQIASGLSAAHQQGLVHRDIKPSNILLDQGVERALITDFGLARAVDDAALTCTGFHPGTPQFMSPEQAAGEAVDARSDLFSLGSVLYTMCTGRPPFRAESSLAVLRRIADDQPRRIREVNASIPTWLGDVIGKLMAKRPSDRFQSAASVAALLEKCLAHVQQPEFNSLPVEIDPSQVNRQTDSPNLSLAQKARRSMVKTVLPVMTLAALLAAGFFWQQAPDSESLAALQGEWLLVASERDGKPWPADQLFNERLVIQGTKFSRPQTAPGGTELRGESGSVSIGADDLENAIDLRLWEGTARGIYKLSGDELMLCVTREGGPRPDSFQTKPQDSRVLNTYRRNPKGSVKSKSTQTDIIESARMSEAERKWRELWMKKIPQELSGSMPREQVEMWLRKAGFRDVVAAPVTPKALQLAFPGIDERAIQRDGLRDYLHGVLPYDGEGSNPKDRKAQAIEVYCLFGADDRMIGLQVGPRLFTKVNQPENGANQTDQGGHLRIPSLVTRPVMAENAPVLASVGPEHPVRLGEIVPTDDVTRGVDPSVVRLHVWDWSKSDLSRVMLIQRSELGTIFPDGTKMLTQEGETIDFRDKQTRQYSGFTVPPGQRITALQVSPSGSYATALIHLRIETEELPTDPPTLETRHFWSLRLLQLDAATNTGRCIGEYPADARPGVAFSTDESFVVYSTDQHSMVRRELPTGKVLNTYEPSFGVHGAVRVAVAPDQHLVAAAGYQGTTYVWDTRTGMVSAQYDALRPDGSRDLSFKPAVLRFSTDSKKLLMVSGNHMKVVDVATGDILGEHRETAYPSFVHAQWSPDDEIVHLLTSSQRSESPTQSRVRDQTGRVSRTSAERYPRVYEWHWKTGTPEPKQYSAASETVSGRIDPDMEARRFTGTWRIVDRTTAGVEQEKEIGQLVHLFHGRMGEVRLEVDPNQTPRTVDVIFMEGPEKGKVLKGIYEWIPRWKGSISEPTVGTREALRICTFTEPHPDKPNERPSGFQAGKNVDFAIWEHLSEERPAPQAPDRPSGSTDSAEQRKPDSPTKVDQPNGADLRLEAGEEEIEKQ